MDDRVGTIIGERYRVLARLGEGAMGVVYRVEHVHMRKTFALKVLLSEMMAHPEIVQRFEREAVAAGSIAHPNVAAATDFGRLDDGSFFLVLEYVGGRSLRDVITALGALEPGRALRIARSVALGVGAAHEKGIVHRDLKPENIMVVDNENGEEMVKVLDFGIAKVDVPVAKGDQPLTRMGSVFGTPDYMAPEQALGQPVDRRADLYALGVILFELLTGDRPFHGELATLLRQHVVADTPDLPPVVMERVDARVAPIVKRLMAKTPEGRYDSAQELVAALDEVLAVSPTPPVVVVPAPAVTRGAIAWSPFARQRRKIVIAAGAVLLGVTVVAISWSLASRGAAIGTDGTAEGAGVAIETAPRPTPAVKLPPPPASLPPPPAESASAKHRGSGGGGFHIPPPSQWFK
jgi:serine/threonine protein kinase